MSERKASGEASPIEGPKGRSVITHVAIRTRDIESSVDFYRRYAGFEHTLVIYESPHRLVASLIDLIEELGNRPAALARELTKLHEEVLRGPLEAILEEIEARPALKGEFVLVVGKK